MIATVCDECGKNLSGTTLNSGYYRQSYLTLIDHKCVSPYANNETDRPDKHFCHVGCLKRYYDKVRVSTSV